MVTLYQVHIQESVLPALAKDKKWIYDEETAAGWPTGDVQQGALSRFTKSVSDWFRFQVRAILDVRLPSK